MGTFDADTPPDEHRRISGTADFVITNPDMLHSGLLPNHNFDFTHADVFIAAGMFDYDGAYQRLRNFVSV